VAIFIVGIAVTGNESTEGTSHSWFLLCTPGDNDHQKNGQYCSLSLCQEYSVSREQHYFLYQAVFQELSEFVECIFSETVI
jgi:hypothetical protein